jgi:hypothetical protein
MDRSPSPSRRTTPDITGNMLRSHLQNLLEQKSTQLQTLGTMGQEILKQQQELEERIRDFEEDDDEEVGQGTKTKLKELDDAMRMWESQNEDMMRELGGKVGPHLRMKKEELMIGTRHHAVGSCAFIAFSPTTKCSTPSARYGIRH